MFLWLHGVLRTFRKTFHYTRYVTQHLSDTFPNGGIGHGITISWPPRSPDLTPLYFCVWGYMKCELFRRKVDTEDELLDLITDVTARIKESQDATRPVLTRVPKCIELDSGIFENVLH